MSPFRTPESRWLWSISPLFVATLLLIFFVSLPLVSSASGLTLKQQLTQKQAALNAALKQYNSFQDQLDQLGFE